jgi:hypothetical protein
MKRSGRRMCALFCLSLAGSPGLFAWNATGHKAITFLAYSLLTPKARGRVDAILKAHPDYRTILAARSTASADAVDLAHNAFAVASTWPDIIKSDPRFSDTPVAGAPALPGFPDMLRHQNWHYINTPVPAEFEKQPIDPVNVTAELKRLLRTLKKDGVVSPEEAFALPWIMHLVTDIHQPLHTVSRFYRSTNGAVEQDKGGNACYIAEERNLHSLWDSILGVNSVENPVARQAASLQDHYPQPRKVNLKPETWIREGVAVAQTVVYDLNSDCRDKEHPAPLPQGYREKARAVAKQRAALAAYRLAALLNDKFD